MGQDATEAVERAHREHWGRLLALLVGQLRSLDLAEECLADAFERALRRWPASGVPDRPDAWLLTAARNRGIDLLRRDSTLARKLPLLMTDADPERGGASPAPGAEEVDEMSTIPDERLRLLFTCCHPALAIEARIALTLRMVGGLTTPEIARAFLVSVPTMGARLTRAKKKIASAGIPYRVPTDAELPDRLGGVLAVLYLVFTEGYSATSGDAAIRRSLCDEAIRLTRVLVGRLPDEPDAAALLALMLIQHSRRDARSDAAGRLVLLPDQDRSAWHRAEIDEGVRLLRRAAAPGRLTPYLLQAAIASEHAVSPTAAATDWPKIARLYAELERVTGSPVVRLNRAVAVAESEGPAAGLRLLAGLDDDLAGYHLLPATRADLLRRLGDLPGARDAYQEALGLAGNAADRQFLTDRLAELTACG